jgi:hypothetical protein
MREFFTGAGILAFLVIAALITVIAAVLQLFEHFDAWLAYSVASAFALGLWSPVKALIARLLADDSDELPPSYLALYNPSDRAQVQSALSRMLVRGDANIRNGVLCPVVLPQDLPPLAARLRAVAKGLSDGRLPIPYNLHRAVGRKDGPGWGYEAVELGLSDIVDIATALERVVEDRRASRSLYKGMTDDEIAAMARTAVAGYYRRNQEFDLANETLSGGRDAAPSLAIARETIELIYRVKGASLG